MDHPPPSSTEVKEGVELYFYSNFGPSWYVLVWNLTFSFTAVTYELFRDFR